MGVGMPQSLLLKQFGDYVRDAFGHMAYHVGSSLEKKDGWRDVDVRVLIPDEAWVALELGEPGYEHNNRRWRAITLAWSAFGRAHTGLPIDFQLQQQSYANREFGRDKGSSRSALFTAGAQV